MSSVSSRRRRCQMSRNYIAHSIVFAAALTATIAFGADAQNGMRIAQRWCASCHIIGPGQRSGSDRVPPFAEIARIPNFDASKIALFLLDPHPKMPDMSLTRDEAADLAAYIASLK
jgi:mono/diheme cytochrome c family protein